MLLWKDQFMNKKIKSKSKTNPNVGVRVMTMERAHWRHPFLLSVGRELSKSKQNQKIETKKLKAKPLS